MDILESVVGRFRKKEDHPKPISATLEDRFTPQVWTYKHFREYLLALGRDRNFLLSIDQYPDLIELSGDWHKTLEDLRIRTHQTFFGKEHYSVIGFTEIARKLSLPQVPSVGTSGTVPSEVVKTARSSAYRAGIDKILGDIHSHPHEDHLLFSLGDLYGMVYPGSTEFVRAIVGTNENLFVFKARESTDTGLDDKVLTQEGFCKYWYENNGYRFLGKNKNGENATRLNKNAPTLWGLNLKIAQRHNLVFYSGDATSDLVKVFPSSKNK